MIWREYTREYRLNVARSNFECSANPYHAWNAINFCAEHNIPFPPWIIAYLTQCSERMMSEKAEKTSDFRGILPWIFGFPKKKHGPGKLLDPLRDEKQLRFTLDFGVRVLNGDDPVTARRNACNAVFDGKAANVDDKTLMRWVLLNLDLKKAPKNTEEWEKVVYKFLLSFCAVSFQLDPAATSEDARKLIAALDREILADTASRQSLAKP
jgi:hypothetical protein